MEGGGINVTDSSSSIDDTVSILVVDDDITCLAIVAAILKKFKYEVVTVKHANDALCTLRIKGGAFDLVVSDVHMPDMNGFELQQAISQEFNLPVVLMSADDKEGVALKGLECGAAFFIMKPVSADDLRDLWQFAAMTRRDNNPLVYEEKTYVSDEIIGVSASSSSVNEEDDAMNKKESKRKSPKKDRSDEKNGENSSQKRPKIVWTNSLHNRFLEAIRSIGLDRAVPKKILEVMNVPGLTRENVASHLQKYRIFLRRVSDASYKIQYSSHKGLSRNLKLNSESSRISPLSTLTPNRLNKLSYQNPPLPNLEATSSISDQSRLLWQRPSIGTSNLMSCQNTSIHAHLANISLEDHSHAMSPTPDAFPNATYDAITSKKNIGSPDVTSSLSLKNLTYQTNYVGYSISNIKNIAESRQSEKYEAVSSSRGVTNLPSDHAVLAATAANDGNNLDLLAKNSGREQLCDVVADYRSMQLPLVSCFENGGVIQESDPSQIFDMSEFQLLSAQQGLEQGCLGTNLQNQLTIHNQAQQNNGGGNSNFYGDMVQWDNCVNVPYSFDPTPNQIQSCQLSISQGFTTSSQLNGTQLLPTNEQQVLEGLANSLEFGTHAHLSKTDLSPTNERNDDDFLESLLAPFAEDHSLEGSNM